MFVLRVIMSEVITNDDQGVSNETDPTNEMATTLGVSFPECKPGTPNNPTQTPARQVTQPSFNNPHSNPYRNSYHKIGCRCSNCCAMRADRNKKEEESILSVMEQSREVLEFPPSAPAAADQKENEALVVGASNFHIAEKTTQHDPGCRCRDCQYEACEHGWELVEDRLYTNDSPQEEFCNLQELIDICDELDEMPDGGYGN